MKTSEFCVLIVFAFLLFSCNAKPKDNWEQEYDKLELQKKQNIQSIADSTVNLSFCGIALGQPFSQTITLAKKNGKIRNVKYQIDGNDKSATCSAVLILPENENGQIVDVKICSFQDTITSFIIMSDVYETHEAIIDLYKNKYNKDFCKNEDNAESWEDNIKRSGSDSWIWTFKNQSLRVSNFYTEERENYIKDASMRSPENRYGVRYTKYFAMISIIYSDLHQVKKVDAYESKVNKQKQIEQAKCDSLKNINDSILRVKRKKRALQQDI